jgi:predicted MFS family arabinose efflux permease
MLLSENTSTQDQGIVMGIKASFWVLAWTLSVILGDYLSHQFSVIVPLQLAAVVLAICLLLSFVISTKNSIEVSAAMNNIQ